MHSLEDLVKLCSDLDPEFKWLYEVAEKLSDYAVSVRYPGEFYIPTIDEAKECFELAKQVKDFISKKMTILEISRE